MSQSTLSSDQTVSLPPLPPPHHQESGKGEEGVNLRDVIWSDNNTYHGVCPKWHSNHFLKATLKEMGQWGAPKDM